MKRQGYIADYVRVPDAVMIDAEAKFKPDDRKIYIREGIWVAAEKNVERARFTIIHECAHAALNHQFERKRSLFGQAIAQMRVASIRRDEKQANKLAASVLSPFHRAEFSLATTVEQLMERFGLSAPAASIRAEEMAGIFRRRNKLPRPLPPGVVDFLAARRRDGHIVTSLPSADVAAMQVRQLVYTGDACPVCGGFKMIRTGTMMKCDFESCGAVTGDD